MNTVRTSLCAEHDGASKALRLHHTAHMCSHLSLQHTTTQHNKCRPQYRRPYEIKISGF